MREASPDQGFEDQEPPYRDPDHAEDAARDQDTDWTGERDRVSARSYADEPYPGEAYRSDRPYDEDRTPDGSDNDLDEDRDAGRPIDDAYPGSRDGAGTTFRDHRQADERWDDDPSSRGDDLYGDEGRPGYDDNRAEDNRDDDNRDGTYRDENYDETEQGSTAGDRYTTQTFTRSGPEVFMPAGRGLDTDSPDQEPAPAARRQEKPKKSWSLRKPKETEAQPEGYGYGYGYGYRRRRRMRRARGAGPGEISQFLAMGTIPSAVIFGGLIESGAPGSGVAAMTLVYVTGALFSILIGLAAVRRRSGRRGIFLGFMLLLIPVLAIGGITAATTLL